MIKRIGLVIGSVTLLLVAILWIVDKLNKSVNDLLPASVTTLKEDEAEKVIIDKGRLIVVTPDGIRQPVHVPPSGRVVATRMKDGTMEIKVKNKGLSVELGGGLLYSDTVRAGLDIQVAYWDRFGLHVGVAGAKAKPVLIGQAMVSYRLDQVRLQNTSLYLSVTTLKMPGVGFRVEF